MRILTANTAGLVGATGGMEKVNCLFANEMSRRGHTVAHFIVTTKRGRLFSRLMIPSNTIIYSTMAGSISSIRCV